MNATLKLLVESFGGERALARKSPICAGRYNSTKANDVRSFCLSSLRAESARAFTVRRYPNSGKGEDFLTGQPDFFTVTAVTPERKVEKSFPRWEINRHGEG